MKRLLALPTLCLSLVACADHKSGRISSLQSSVSNVAFQTRTELPLGVRSSVDVAVADLDGNGITDLAAADLEGAVAIRIGLGQGTFATRETLLVDGKPLAIVAADLNGDTLLDLTVVSADADVATIFLNSGNTSFQRSQVVGVRELPIGAIIGDYTGDAIPDMVVMHLSRSDFLLFTGNGDGTFGTPISITVPRGTRTAGLTVADVNQDGNQDILICDTDNDRLVIRFGPSGATGVAVAVVPVGQTPVAISLGDVDADGRVDIAVSCFNGASIDFVTHQGANQFGVFRSLPVSGNPALSAIADIDADGFADLSVCLLNKSAVSIFAGSATGLGSGEYQLPATGFPYRPIVADLVGDGRPDLALVPTGENKMNVYESTTEGLRCERTVASSTRNPQVVTSADFDGDGQADIATAGSSTGVISILSPTRTALGPVLREVWSVDVGQGFSNLSAADVDRDGRADLLLGVIDGVMILANESVSGVLAFRQVPAAGSGVLISGVDAAGMDVADVTGDGILDVVVAFLGDQRIVVLPGTRESFVFGAPVETATNGHPFGLSVADFDTDGKPEVAVTLATESVVAIFETKPNGQLGEPVNIPVGPGPTFLRKADFDGDGRMDLAVSSALDNSLQLLIAAVGGGFRPLTIPTGTGPTALLARDLDLDGFPDLLVTTLNAMTFEVLLGDGRGGVKNRLVFPGVYGATSAVLADVVGSEMPDLVIGSAEIDRVTVYQNISVKLGEQ